MKNSCPPMLWKMAAAIALTVPMLSAPAQTITQTITLQPGWNAVWLEVRPTNNATALVFSNLPVASVWTRADRLSPVDFIQNASEEAFNQAGWLGWFHPSRPEAFLGNLFAVQANRAYLIRATNSVPVVWNVTGRPALRTPEWVPDAYNLRGLPVDPVTPPTFLDFFRPSKAHYHTVSGQLEKIYRLNGAGQWAQVSPGDPTKSGEACWIYTRGASDYLAPLTAKVDLGDGLDFGLELTELDLRLANRTSSSMNAVLQEVNSGGAGHLSYYQFSPTLGGQWPALPSPLVVAPAAGGETRVRLAVRRQDFTATNYASVLELRDGAGTRLLVPVEAQIPAFAVAAPGASGGPPHKNAATESATRAGLWVGSASLHAVSEAHSANPTNPMPVNAPLNLRLLLHVDTNGQTRLLKEVLQMWRDGTYTNDGGGNLVVDKPGQYVLLTDDTLIPMFSGSAVRDGASVGRRLSTVGYDFPGHATNNFLNLTGLFAIGESLTGTLTLPHDGPTNPFKHKYHPDHDNLNARFDGPTNEAFATARQIAIEFTASPPDGPAVPNYGYNQMGGHYRETITGIHKNAIHVSGTFRLSRVSLIGELNPSPAP